MNLPLVAVKTGRVEGMCIALESDLRQLQFCGYPSYFDSVNYLMR